MLKKQIKNKQTNMKNALLDQILLWILVFVAFSGFVLFVVDYTNAIKIKKNIDTMAEYAARTKAIGEDHSTIASTLNSMRLKKMDTISAANITCLDDSGAANKRELVFNITVSYNNKLLPTVNTINETATTFNDVDSVIRTCNLTITLK